MFWRIPLPPVNYYLLYPDRYFTGPVSSLIGRTKRCRMRCIAADRLFEIMDLERESDENQIELTAIKWRYPFENVSFRSDRVAVFEDLNLVIPKGKFTAIVGESGSGKSTLMVHIAEISIPYKMVMSVSEVMT